MSDSPKIADAPPGRCAKCEAPLTGETRVRLWDGRSYCRACVEAACPGLAKRADRGGVLVGGATAIMPGFRTFGAALLILGALSGGAVVSACGVGGLTFSCAREPGEQRLWMGFFDVAGVPYGPES